MNGPDSDTPRGGEADAPLREAFRRRAEAALARIVATASSRAIADALSAPTDVGMIARALSEADVVGAAVLELDPGVDRMAAFAARAATLVGMAGGLMGAEDVASFLRISRQAVEKRRRAGKLLAMPQGGDWRYPRCQFGETDVLGGVPNMVRRLGGRGAWEVLGVLVSPSDALGGESPVTLLSRGGADRARVSDHVDELSRSDWSLAA